MNRSQIFIALMAAFFLSGFSLLVGVASHRPDPAMDDLAARHFANAISAPHIVPNGATEVQQSTDATGTTYTFYNLKHRAASHTTPDAIVRVPNGFDPYKPIHLVIYNHGFYTDVTGAYATAQLAAQMQNAPPNTVLIVPEWQLHPGAASSNSGAFRIGGLFAGMVQDAFDGIPALHGRTLDDMSTVTILAHSAGYVPAEVELYANGIEDKVICVTLLDALYDSSGFDDWLKTNIKDLSAGKKRFYNFFYGTSRYSKAQAARVKQMLSAAGLSASIVDEDYQNGDKVMSAADIAAHSIVFKYSAVKTADLEPHFTIPVLYVQPVVSVPYP